MTISKYAKLSILLAFFASNTAFSGVAKYNENIDQLELAQEVEDMDLYDEATMVKEEKQLTKQLSAEAVKLESNLKRANKKQQAAAQTRERLKIKRLEAQKKRDLVFAQAKKAEREQQREESRVEKLRSEIQTLESKVQEAKEKTTTAREQIREMKQESNSLSQRKRVAVRQIEQNKRELQKLKAEKQKRSKANKKLSREVSKLEAKAQIYHD